MPTVPIYKRQVKEAPVPALRNTALADGSAFGGVQAKEAQALGGSLQSAGGQMMDIGLKTAQRESEARIREAMNFAQDSLRGYRLKIGQRKGKEALGVSKEAVNYLTDLKKKTADMAESQFEAEHIGAAFNRLHGRTMDFVNGHQAAETERYRQMQLDGEISNAFQDAAEIAAEGKDIIRKLPDGGCTSQVRKVLQDFMLINWLVLVLCLKPLK